MHSLDETSLGFAVLLIFFRERGRFPRAESEVEAHGVAGVKQRRQGQILQSGNPLQVAFFSLRN